MVQLGLVETTEDEEDGGTDTLGWSGKEIMVILLGQGSYPNKKMDHRSGFSFLAEERREAVNYPGARQELANAQQIQDALGGHVLAPGRKGSAKICLHKRVSPA